MDIGLPLFVAFAVLSSRLEPEITPENSRALRALATIAVENVTVMVSPLTSAVVAVVENTTERAPVIDEPFVASASLVY